MGVPTKNITSITQRQLPSFRELSWKWLSPLSFPVFRCSLPGESGDSASSTSRDCQGTLLSMPGAIRVATRRRSGPRPHRSYRTARIMFRQSRGEKRMAHIVSSPTPGKPARSRSRTQPRYSYQQLRGRSGLVLSAAAMTARHSPRLLKCD